MTVEVSALARVALAATLALALALALWPSGSADAAGSYAPTFNVRYCNALPANFPSSVGFNDADLVGNPACVDPNPIVADTAYNTTYDLGLSGGNYNVGSPITALVSPDEFVATDAGITNGAKVGGVSGSTTVGLLNGACTSSQAVEFILYDSTTDVSQKLDPVAGSGGPFANFVTDSNSDSFADSTSPFVGKYPSFYAGYFDPDLDYPGGPDGPVAPIQPRARYTGMTRVPALFGDWQLASLFLYDAGALAPFAADADNRPGPLGRVGRAPSDAQAYVAILNDPVQITQTSSLVTDLCTPLSLRVMLRGTTPGAQVRAKTPPSNGTRIAALWTFSQRDADGDGLENGLDTCPLNPNTGVDSDNDGIDNACDAAINSGGSDVDGDGFSNRADNCPQVANGGAAQRDGELATTYALAAPDGGPNGDSIGDACDPHSTRSDTEGGFIEKLNFVAKCIGGGDVDGDGYCAAQDVNDGDPGVRGYSLNGGSDVDGVGAAGGDGFNSNVELYVGTDPLKRCSNTPAANDEAVDASPADFDDNRLIDINDVLTLKPIFDIAVPSVSTRFDIVPNKVIDITDVLALKPIFGVSC